MMVIRNLFLFASVILVSQATKSARHLSDEKKLSGLDSPKRAASEGFTSLEEEILVSSTEILVSSTEANELGHRHPLEHRHLSLATSLDWLWDLLRSIFSFSWLFPNKNDNGNGNGTPVDKVCCDPDMRPDGQKNRPLCFEGSLCCSDGNWQCNEGDGLSTCSEEGKACPATSSEAPVEAPVASPVPTQ